MEVFSLKSVNLVAGKNKQAIRQNVHYALAFYKGLVSVDINGAIIA